VSQPCDLGAHEARSAMLRGELSPVELTVSCLERVDELNPKLNAVVARWDEVALNAARAAERELQAGNATGVLHGLPVAIKDLQATQGLVTTYGTEFYRRHVPSEDAGIVARVKAAGGIIIGKTNIPEMSIGANTINRIFGATGNPYDPTMTCGGSSGGSAVAVAAGMAPLATGSDHGGSLRIPASFCGVVGHRATPGTVPNETRTVTQTNYSLQGPMARTVDDAALLLAAIARRDRDSRRDPMSFPLDANQFLTIDAPALEDFEIGFTQDFGGLPVSAHVRDSFAQRVEYLEERGAKVREVELDLSDAIDVDWQLRADIFATQYHREIEFFDDTFNPNVFRSYETALSTSVLAIAQARRRQKELFETVDHIFDDVDVLLCPTVSVPPFPWTSLHPSAIDGCPVDNYMAWLGLTSCLTVVGHPVTALPAGLDNGGLPVGLQCVGPMYQDWRLLGFAKCLEGHFADSAMFAASIPDRNEILQSDAQCEALGRKAAIAAAQ